MSINETYEIESYISNGVITEYDFNFEILNENNLVVSIKDLDNNVSELVLNTDYTVEINSDRTGKIILTTAPTLDYVVFIERNVSIEQEKEFQTSSGFQAKSIENSLDKLTIVSQQLKEELERALKFSQFLGEDVSATVPVPQDGKALKWKYDSDTDTYSWENSEFDPDTLVDETETIRDETEGFKDESLAYRNEAETFRDEAETFRDEAENYSENLVFNSYNTGEIVQSTTPLTDAGLHLLDGSLILAGGIYDGFYLYMKDLYDSGSYTNLFTTESDYQDDITNFGGCEKFVFDDGVSVRLPTAYDKNRFVIEENVSSDSWYRIYNDGWIEQGGKTDSLIADGNSTVNLNTPFTDTNYTIVATYTDTNFDITSDGAIGTLNKTTTNFTFRSGMGSATAYANWTAKGYGPTPNGFNKPKYKYIVVATSVKTNIVVDIDNIITDLDRIENSVGYNFIDGFVVNSNSTNPTTDIDFEVGKALCKDTITYVLNTSPETVNIRELYNTINDITPIDTALAADTTYHIFRYKNDSSVDSWHVSTSDNPTISDIISSGAYRRIFSFITDGDGDIIEFNSYEEGLNLKTIYKNRQFDLNLTGTIQDLTNNPMAVPNGDLTVLFNANYDENPGSVSSIRFLNKDEDDTVDFNEEYGDLGSSETFRWGGDFSRNINNSTLKIKGFAGVSFNISRFYIFTRGYILPRINN